MMAGMAGTSGTADDDAFAALFEEHYEPLVRLARLLVDDRGSGEEVVQDAFVRVYRRWAKVDDPVRYVRRAVVNGARSRLRHRAVVRRYVAPAVRSSPAAEDEVVRLASRGGRGRGASPAPSSAGVPRAPLLRRALGGRDRGDARHLGGLGEVPLSRGIAALGRVLGEVE